METLRGHARSVGTMECVHCGDTERHTLRDTEGTYASCGATKGDTEGKCESCGDTGRHLRDL